MNNKQYFAVALLLSSVWIGSAQSRSLVAPVPKLSAPLNLAKAQTNLKKIWKEATAGAREWGSLYPSEILGLTSHPSLDDVRKRYDKLYYAFESSRHPGRDVILRVIKRAQEQLVQELKSGDPHKPLSPA